MKFAINEVAVIAPGVEADTGLGPGDEVTVIGIDVLGPFALWRFDYAIQDSQGETHVCDECCLRKRRPPIPDSVRSIFSGVKQGQSA